MSTLGLRYVTMIAIATGLLVPSTSQAEHRAALLIGNAAYGDDLALDSPTNDIKAVARVLRQHGFHNKLVTNLDHGGLESAIDQFVKSAPINGTALIYFSGYVLTAQSDGEPADPILLGIEGMHQGISLRELTHWLSLQAATTRNLIVLDGSYPHPDHPVKRGPNGISAIEALPRRIWLGYAAGANEIRTPAATGLSLFASAISMSTETDFEKRLTEACGWTTTTLGKRPVAQQASLTVSPPDKFPRGGNPGDEWVSPDGTIFCWCPPANPGHGFWIGKYEVPQCKWPIPGVIGAIGRRRNHPAHYLETQDTLARLAARTTEERVAGRLPRDWEYALPSPEQWEHAARAGSSSERFFEESALAEHANFADKSLFETEDEVYLYADKMLDDGAPRLAPVGTYLPNAWGLHDVYGNVWEQTDTGVLCGGSWVSLPDYCRATVRKPPLNHPTDYVGLRIVIRPVAAIRHRIRFEQP